MESGNQVLMQAFSLKLHKLVDLVQAVHDVVESQYREVKRLLVGLANFKLTEEFQCFSVDLNAQYALGQVQRAEHFQRFMALAEEAGIYGSVDDSKTSLVPKHREKFFWPSRVQSKPNQHSSHLHSHDNPDSGTPLLRPPKKLSSSYLQLQGGMVDGGGFIYA